MRKSKFTEAETEAFDDAEDSLYRSFWDSEGSRHWGYFENGTPASAADFIPACQRWPTKTTLKKYSTRLSPLMGKHWTTMVMKLRTANN